MIFLQCSLNVRIFFHRLSFAVCYFYFHLYFDPFCLETYTIINRAKVRLGLINIKFCMLLRGCLKILPFDLLCIGTLDRVRLLVIKYVLKSNLYNTNNINYFIIISGRLNLLPLVGTIAKVTALCPLQTYRWIHLKFHWSVMSQVTRCWDSIGWMLMRTSTNIQVINELLKQK